MLNVELLPDETIIDLVSPWVVSLDDSPIPEDVLAAPLPVFLWTRGTIEDEIVFLEVMVSKFLLLMVTRLALTQAL
jgi:hypothetical protein